MDVIGVELEVCLGCIGWFNDELEDVIVFSRGLFI